MREDLGLAIFESLGYIDPEYIEQAANSRGVERNIPGRTIKLLLIAAALLSLLTAAACAAAWFGLGARLISLGGQGEAGAGEGESYVSLAGLRGSPEFLAAGQWLEFKNRYEEKMARERLAEGESPYGWRDLERGFARENEYDLAVSRIYGVWDEAMLRELKDIAGEYGLSLHTRAGRPGSGELEGTVYENGAYKYGFMLPLHDRYNLVTVYYEPWGTLPAMSLPIYAPGEYEQWEYETDLGARVDIALRRQSIDVPENYEPSPGELSWDCLIFCRGKEADLTLSCSWSGEQGPQNTAEDIADALDFEALLEDGSISAVAGAIKEK